MTFDEVTKRKFTIKAFVDEVADNFCHEDGDKNGENVGEVASGF